MGTWGRWWALQGCVNLEAPAEMSALQLGYEGLGSPRAVWAGVPAWLSPLCPQERCWLPPPVLGHIPCWTSSQLYPV